MCGQHALSSHSCQSLVLGLSTDDLGGERYELVLGLSVGDLGDEEHALVLRLSAGEKQALVMRLSAGDLGLDGESVTSS